MSSHARQYRFDRPPKHLQDHPDFISAVCRSHTRASRRRLATPLAPHSKFPPPLSLSLSPSPLAPYFFLDRHPSKPKIRVTQQHSFSLRHTLAFRKQLYYEKQQQQEKNRRRKNNKKNQHHHRGSGWFRLSYTTTTTFVFHILHPPFRSPSLFRHQETNHHNIDTKDDFTNTTHGSRSAQWRRRRQRRHL